MSAQRRRAGACQAVDAQRRRGMSLVELLIGIAITATLLMSMTRMLANATAASSIGAPQLDLQQQAQFAVQRIALQVGAMPNLLLTPKSDDTTSAPWSQNPLNLAYSYAWDSNAKTLTETQTAGGVTHVIANAVTAFAITSPAVSAGQTIIAVSLTLKSGDATASASLQTRMGSLL